MSRVLGLDYSGFNAGEIFQFNGVKYRVLAGEDGLIAEPVKKPAGEKKPARRK